MPYEGAPPSEVPERLEMIAARLGRGAYTDDTEMMIAVAESLLARGAIEPADVAARFLDGCNPARGYGAGTLAVFELWRRGWDVEEAAAQLFDGAGSYGNGAAMRIAPVAVRFHADPGRLVQQAGLSARVTHTHPLGVDGAVVQAAAIGAAAGGVPILAVAQGAATTEELRLALETVERLLGENPTPAGVARQLGSSSGAHRSVPTAIYSAIANQDFEAAVAFAVRCGGDTDTIGAMAGAIAGARAGVAGIPQRWLDPLERGPRGREHVEALALELASAARSSLP